MKAFLKFILLFLILAGIILVGCTNDNSEEDYSAQIVVENYFKYKNDKNIDKLFTTLTDHWYEHMLWGLDLDSVNIIDIKEANKKVSKEWLNNRRGKVSGTTLDNLKVYQVKFEASKEMVVEQWEWYFFVIRRNEDSPWLIDDIYWVHSFY